ncbi:MAG: hypothetical protein M1825_005918 [Sarcosagium campestre]|nr:MAG: hypothetical protein M1825_005918 [Sarcosagium campestre]
MPSFDIIRTLGNARIGPRLGVLNVADRLPLQTPNYISSTTRGSIPHISPDVLKSHVNVRSIHVALEDFIEKASKSIPPILRLTDSWKGATLRRFIALPEDSLLILAPRRVNAVPCPAANLPDGISIYTSVGFSRIKAQEYADAVAKLQPDIVVGMADVVIDQPSSSKRKEKMGDRTSKWTKLMIEIWKCQDDTSSRLPAIFAPILPIPAEQQSFYLEDLVDEYQTYISGLVFYEADSTSAVPNALESLPRMLLGDRGNPHDILRQTSLGVDLFTNPIVGAATDSGIALTFLFSHSRNRIEDVSPPLDLGLDMWQPEHSTILSPLLDGCACYTCRKHHRAYVQHLLVAKEMLGWVLLQIHNLHVLDRFFGSIRKSIKDGTFEEDVASFTKDYKSEMPEKTGMGPRVRGYQYKSQGPHQGGDARKNEVGYRRLDDVASKDDKL